MAMLTQIINEFRSSEGPLDLNELGHRLGVDRSALEGMLELLVRQGRLREAGADTGNCNHCAARLSCAQVRRGGMLGRSYKLVR